MREHTPHRWPSVEREAAVEMFEFRQNNSGGSFEKNDARGIGVGGES